MSSFDETSFRERMELEDFGGYVPKVNVVDERFITEGYTELNVKVKRERVKVIFEVFDCHENLLLTINGVIPLFRERKFVMKSTVGEPILTLQEKRLSARDKWHAYRGESTKASNTLFTVQRAGVVFTQKYNVFLASNPTEGAVGNFQVVGRWKNMSFTLFEYERMLAKIEHSNSWSSLKGKDKLHLKIKTGVDYAFVVALLVILCENYEG